MNDPTQGTPTAVSRLRAALEGTAIALATADLARLLAADTELQAALQALPRAVAVNPEERLQLRRELEAAAAALIRCRRLGVGLSDLVRISLDAQGGQLGYEPTRAAAASLAGRGFTRRV